ncbi:MAG: fumarylacetoacetase [Fimbriimonas sp.]
MTHIPQDAKSWVEVDPQSHFPIQNLPFGLACRDENEMECVVVRIGDYVLDLCALSACGLIPEDDYPILHSLIDLDKEDLRRLRGIVYDLLREDNPTLRDNKELCADALVPLDQVDMVVPTEIPQFVDFYAGIHHASNVGRMFRPDQPPLLPNYRHVPVGYNGRASSVIPSDIPVRRPKGQTKTPEASGPTFGPTQELDFELELGFFVSDGNEMGEPISVEDAENHILGFVLVNDWSARDVQRWEYQPLGPFLAKSFATSISPWIVLTDALEPFRIQGPEQDPEPLPYLKSGRPGHFDIHLEVAIQTPAMTRPQVLTRSNARHLYWSFAQLLTHQTSNGTNVEPGDLYASGTVSGPEDGSFGSLLELTWRGSKPIRLTETGEERTYLEDGDTVIMTGYCQGYGYRIGFGELRTTVIG